MFNIKLRYFLIILISVLIFGFIAGHYYTQQKNNKKLRITLEEPALEPLVSLLKVYDTFDDNGPIKLIRLGRDNDGGYIVPTIALIKATALLGYGISDDISFEEQFSNIYQKKSYGFDCTINNINTNNKLCSFIPQCIGPKNSLNKDKYSYFEQQLKNLNLEHKQIFIKMDIEGAEYNVFSEILKHNANITGIVIEIHFNNESTEYRKAINLLEELNKYFFLIHVHGNNWCGKIFTTKNSKGYIPKVLELTYINKSLAQKATIATNQTHPKKIDMPNRKNHPDWKFEILSP